MTPPLTPGMADALRARRPLALLAEIDHPDGIARFWTGVGKLNWNGFAWTGSGGFGTVTPIKHTSDLIIQEINFLLIGVDPAIVAKLNDNVRNLSGKVWFACIGIGNTVIRDPYQIVDAILDYQSFSAAEDGTVSISITARTGFYTLERAIDESWTTEEQKLLFRNDSGLDLIAGLQNQNIQWTPT
jgi:hypothetical protein